MSINIATPLHLKRPEETHLEKIADKALPLLRATWQGKTVTIVSKMVYGVLGLIPTTITSLWIGMKSRCRCRRRPSSSLRYNKLSLGRQDILPKNAKFHGTAFCTLFIMGKLSGQAKHSLIPFGKLATSGFPCFVGECAKGVTGINKRGTSWTSCASTAKSYATAQFGFGSGGERYGIKASRSDLQGLIREYFDFNSKKFSMFTYNQDSLYWERYLLSVRRLRHFDDDAFQKEFAADLRKWAETVIEHQQESLTSEFEMHKLRAEEMVKYSNQFIAELTIPIDPLAKNERDRQHLSDTTPIVFVSKNITEEEAYQKGDSEYVVERFMTLGRDIDYILTTEEHIPRVTKYLSDQELADRVRVFSLSILDTMIK